MEKWCKWKIIIRVVFISPKQQDYYNQLPVNGKKW